MSSITERTLRLSERLSERPRELQEVELRMVDGTEIRGMLHRAHGSRTLDFMNKADEPFVALTDATLTRADVSQDVPFIAVNKAHIMRVIETDDA